MNEREVTNEESLDRYRKLWALMWPGGLFLLSLFGVYTLRQIKRSIVAATQQQLVQLVTNGRFFLIDHPELVNIKARTPDEQEFFNSTGGWQGWFMRRNIITHLELLYFQNKYRAIDPAFFFSHCNHIRPWFGNPDFLETWERSKDMHVAEFQSFVDRMILDTETSKDDEER
jgi:hypothetical protein